MIPKPHGGRLVDRVLKGTVRESVLAEVHKLPQLEINADLASDVMNIATGVFSPLEGFMGEDDFNGVLRYKRLATGVPWTIPIVLDVTDEEAKRLGSEVALVYDGQPLAVFYPGKPFRYDQETLAQHVYGTTDRKHPGVARTHGLKDWLVGGRIDLLRDVKTPFYKYSLKPIETRVLFETKGWRTIVGFQTRNVPHLGHEYVQKTALTFTDGLFINPVIGRKKPGDFKDEVILKTYDALIAHYYLKERAVMAILRTEMRYAGPREAIFHAIIRKNFGCTYFIVGRDHAGVGSYYPPYAAQEIFDAFPDLGIVPLFFTAFFHCWRCGSVANEKTCPHGEADRLDFSGTQFRDLVTKGEMPPKEFVRPEVARIIIEFTEPFVT
jgi:sulfate adenylyltransferase